MSEKKAPREIVGWMTWPDYSMMVNEAPEGGFKWEFLDFKPDHDDLKDFNTPIFIYTQRMLHEPLISEEEINKAAFNFGMYEPVRADPKFVHQSLLAMGFDSGVRWALEKMK